MIAQAWGLDQPLSRRDRMLQAILERDKICLLYPDLILYEAEPTARSIRGKRHLSHRALNNNMGVKRVGVAVLSSLFLEACDFRRLSGNCVGSLYCLYPDPYCVIAYKLAIYCLSPCSYRVDNLLPPCRIRVRNTQSYPSSHYHGT
jgi:hypothetical protein